MRKLYSVIVTNYSGWRTALDVTAESEDQAKAVAIQEAQRRYKRNTGTIAIESVAEVKPRWDDGP